MKSTLKLIESYTAVAGPVILKYFRPDCCIAAAAITVEVFNRLHIPAYPLPCRVRIFNRAFVERAEREDRLPQSDAECHLWSTDGSGCWSVGIGYPAPHLTGYIGHLAAIVNGRHLIDASISQASRPEKGILLPPVLCVPVDEHFTRHYAPLGFINATGDGTALSYEPYLDNYQWMTAPDWLDPLRRAPAVTQILNLIEEAA